METKLPFSGLDLPTVGDGHFELSWDPNDEQKVEDAAHLVNNLLEDGYILVKEVQPGKWERVNYFDARRAKVAITTEGEAALLTGETAAGTTSDRAVAIPKTAPGCDPSIE